MKARKLSDFLQLYLPLPSQSLVPEKPRCFASQLSLPPFGIKDSNNCSRSLGKKQKEVEICPVLGMSQNSILPSSVKPDINDSLTLSWTFFFPVFDMFIIFSPLDHFARDKSSSESPPSIIVLPFSEMKFI